MQSNLKLDDSIDVNQNQTTIEEAKPTLKNPKFKKTVNILIDNLRWMNSLMNNAEEHLKEFVVNSEEASEYKDGYSSKVPNFNLNKFRADIRCGRISETAKTILKKGPSKRTEEETRQLRNLVSYRLW